MALLDRYDQLRVAYAFRQSLQYIWDKMAVSQQELSNNLQQWCNQAEESGIELLEYFVYRLKNYTCAYDQSGNFWSEIIAIFS